MVNSYPGHVGFSFRLRILFLLNQIASEKKRRKCPPSVGGCPTGSEPVARATLYLTDMNTFGDFFGAAQTTISFRINIESVTRHERKERGKEACDRKKQGGHSRE